MSLSVEHKKMEMIFKEDVVQLLARYRINYQNVDSERIEAIYSFFYSQKFKKENNALLKEFREMLSEDLARMESLLENNVLEKEFIKVAESVFLRLDYSARDLKEKESKSNKLTMLMFRHYLNHHKENFKKSNYQEMDKFLSKINWNNKDLVEMLKQEILGFYQFKSIKEVKEKMNDLVAVKSVVSGENNIANIIQNVAVRNFILGIFNEVSGQIKIGSDYYIDKDNKNQEIKIDKKIAQLLESKYFMENLHKVKNIKKYGWTISARGGFYTIKLKGEVSNDFFNSLDKEIVKELYGPMNFELINRQMHEEILIEKIEKIRVEQDISHIIKKKNKI